MFGLFDSKDITTTDPIEAIGQAAPEFWIQFIVLCGSIEAAEWKHKQSGSTEPFFDPFKAVPSDPVKAAAKAESELKNGRLAMLSVAAYASAHYIPGSVPGLPAGFH
eukprot:FR742592.1.p1 GENE.FR742592.1~~FR742592.1.p1  ORF type:complete len:107 (+),score=12.45 FR742592.1:3-323(+)